MWIAIVYLCRLYMSFCNESLLLAPHWYRVYVGSIGTGGRSHLLHLHCTGFWSFREFSLCKTSLW
ncbi:unnamed protein product [Linum tenue]|uniref:Secreted protein n=1 Tax=Linum tenue TaxID=586396 RepID=A0AAV0S3B4_9ROSI|nr:unnamed protein product [Linum tenue]